MKLILTFLSLFAILGLSSCANNPSMTRSTVLGGAAGAGAGAIIGNQFGNSGAGLAIGAASGALIGNSRAYRERQRKQEHLRELNMGHHGY
jgi:uncharacterized protein YcfJ